MILDFRSIIRNIILANVQRRCTSIIHVFYTTNKYISRRHYKGGIGYGVELNEK